MTLQPLSSSRCTEAYIARDLVAARDYLRQFRQDFPGLSVRERDTVLDFLETLLVPNLVFNEQETKKRRETAIAQVVPVEMEIRKGKTIFRTGDEITPNIGLAIDRTEESPKTQVAYQTVVWILLFRRDVRLCSLALLCSLSEPSSEDPQPCSPYPGNPGHRARRDALDDYAG